jgi:hypothetical protein
MAKKRMGRPTLLGDDSRRLTFDIPASADDALAYIAREEGVSKATILRWAVEAYTKDFVAAAIEARAKHQTADDEAAAKLKAFVEDRDAKKGAKP